MKTHNSWFMITVAAIVLFTSSVAIATACVTCRNLHTFQNEKEGTLLSEYETKFDIAAKHLKEIKKSITSEQMKKLDVKMKLGEIENTINSIHSKIADLKKSKSKPLPSDFDFLKNQFSSLEILFDQLDVVLK